MQNLTHYIDGKHVDGTSGRFADVYNPATGEVQAQVPLASPDEMAAAVASAKAAQPAKAWPGDDEIRRSAEPRHGQAGRSAQP